MEDNQNQKGILLSSLIPILIIAPLNIFVNTFSALFLKLFAKFFKLFF